MPTFSNTNVIRYALIPEYKLVVKSHTGSLYKNGNKL